MLLYIGGHGVLSQRGQLFFATRNTVRSRLLTTAIDDRFVIDVTDQCRARSIVLVLDCCHSGAFQHGLAPKGKVAVAERFEGEGRVTLCASGKLEYAFEETDARSGLKDLGAEEPGSLFTSAFVKGLKTGEADADQDGDILIDELFKYISERVREDSKHQQTPSRNYIGGHGDIVIAQIPSPTPSPTDSHRAARSGRVAPQSDRRAARITA